MKTLCEAVRVRSLLSEVVNDTGFKTTKSFMSSANRTSVFAETLARALLIDSVVRFSETFGKATPKEFPIRASGEDGMSPPVARREPRETLNPSAVAAVPPVTSTEERVPLVEERMAMTPSASRAAPAAPMAVLMSLMTVLMPFPVKVTTKGEPSMETLRV
jgi:hypothetical protein